MGKYIFDLRTRAKLIEIISGALSECYVKAINGEELLPVQQAEVIANKLMEKGVTILPEGAIILTRAEIEALNKYEEARKNEAN